MAAHVLCVHVMPNTAECRLYFKEAHACALSQLITSVVEFDQESNHYSVTLHCAFTLNSKCYCSKSYILEEGPDLLLGRHTLSPNTQNV